MRDDGVKRGGAGDGVLDVRAALDPAAAAWWDLLMAHYSAQGNPRLLAALRAALVSFRRVLDGQDDVPTEEAHKECPP